MVVRLNHRGRLGEIRQRVLRADGHGEPKGSSKDSVSDAPSKLDHAWATWRYTGKQRPEFAIQPRADQESVWDYPRPPRIEADTRRVQVLVAGITLADSKRCLRVLETASPPTFYLPPQDVRMEYLRPCTGSSVCEWKGRASYWSIYLHDTLIEEP